ncbi:hypothetical protein M885DRAFT_470101 [Pelagophyceae sp. CCMP2097]|nr:hypothetical protein M885DRAFT_470101 [Pelagophyceae sp. CCMP2097]
MPRILSTSSRVVDVPDLTIDEFVGNVACGEDRLSIAVTNVSAACAEPWLTLAYDEWVCVLKGRIVMQCPDGSQLEVFPGQTCFIAKSERFRPVFDAGTQYVPVCIPAFRPDRCIREDDTAEDAAISTKLQQLHAKPTEAPAVDDPAHPEVLYHMCERAAWEAAKLKGEAYFPPTFQTDGFTHATAVPARLIETANHFYQQSSPDWVCLRMSRKALLAGGVITIDEEAMPVGETAVGDAWTTWICPHIRGGIHPRVVNCEFTMNRDGPKFTTIEDLC